MLALIELCKQLPDHPDWMKWYSAILFAAKYYKDIMKYSAPYGMLPEGLYAADEIDDQETFLRMHMIVRAGGSYEEQLAATLKGYIEQLKCGVKIGPKHYMRRFPVWYSFRGNTAVQLSEGKAVSVSSIFLNDYELYNIAQEQFQFVIGKNPFGQSTMYGEGYDYCQMYAVLPGEMVGELGVGMESNDERDAPFWPQLNNCTYKEVWVAAPAKWLWMMADEYLPARVNAFFTSKQNGDVTFKNLVTGAEYRYPLEGGLLACEVPAGRYEMRCGEEFREITLVAGGKYNVKTPLADYAISKEERNGKVSIMVTGTGCIDAELEIRTRNLKVNETKRLSPINVTFECEVINPKEAWAAAVIPNGDMGEILSVIG